MTQIIRPATPADIPRMTDLLMLDAAERQAVDPVLWKIARDAPQQIKTALTGALSDAQQPFRQIWQVAESGDRITGVAHSMLLPVPPVYVGAKGDPGLILPDCFVAPGASEETAAALVDAAEKALQEAGAEIILASFVPAGGWRDVFEGAGYDPLTLYLSSTGLTDTEMPPGVRSATPADVPGIVSRSAENRQVLSEIDPFWEVHPEADTRFSGWMTRSLTLSDRDMMVTGPAEIPDGYVIAQPASRLHFPPAHDTGATGVIDDWYHTGLADAALPGSGGDGALALLRAAEAAFARRGRDAAFVVCPAGWYSRRVLLEDAGYRTAMIWSAKRRRP
ncbi:hypothetical protein [Roseobacter ponti]|uniref:Uncharacterized protein n=1 Tax=Roseobacter ponti TaxID=1891787 RepID=A0A858SVV0_9RHOB|nr:hypothetical protein [Roseobacter ponti]QJF51952.1 hypothetical protein G3256_12640 [Roseobacter ponti]